MRGQSKNRRRRWQTQRGRQSQRLSITEKRGRSRTREEMPPPKLSPAQRDFLRKARRRVRELFLELTDEIIALIYKEVGR
jgi:hypothetical protein